MILLVDDDPEFLQQAQSVLNGGRRGIFFARDAEQARSLMGTVGAAFTSVMVDLDLPGEDGFSLIRDMRHHFPDLPIIAISGVYKKHVLESATLLGAAEALQKPITPEWNAQIEKIHSSNPRP